MTIVGIQWSFPSQNKILDVPLCSSSLEMNHNYVRSMGTYLEWNRKLESWLYPELSMKEEKHHSCLPKR